MEETSVFNVQDLRQEMILIILLEVKESLTKRGYNANHQLAGYLITGDIKYITNYENAREKIKKIRKEEIILSLVSYVRVKK